MSTCRTRRKTHKNWAEERLAINKKKDELLRFISFCQLDYEYLMKLSDKIIRETLDTSDLQMILKKNKDNNL